MWTRPLGDTLTEIAGSMLEFTGDEQQVVRATSIELSLPIEVRIRRTQNSLVFCADVPSWRWQTDWDPPFGQLRLTIEGVRQEINE